MPVPTPHKPLFPRTFQNPPRSFSLRNQDTKSNNPGFISNTTCVSAPSKPLVLPNKLRKMEIGFDPQSSITSELPIQLKSMNTDPVPRDLGIGNFGCTHYRRRCKIRVPCCDEIFDCRHCHNEAKNTIEVDPLDRHDIPRHEVKKVICSLCSTEQDVQKNCINCGVCMGNYFCGKCKFFDDDVTKNQYHCDGCGICRTGGEKNHFHCYKCGCCYSILLKDSHPCVERAMHHNCPVCFEYLFDSTKDVSVLPCGHTIHLDCLREMASHLQFSCPVCSRSICDMTQVWEKLEEEVAATPMPEMYQNKMVWILCNDCASTSEVHFHILAHKCPNCNSYNTRQTRGGPTSCFSSI